MSTVTAVEVVVVGPPGLPVKVGPVLAVMPLPRPVVSVVSGVIRVWLVPAVLGVRRVPAVSAGRLAPMAAGAPR